LCDSKYNATLVENGAEILMDYLQLLPQPNCLLDIYPDPKFVQFKIGPLELGGSSWSLKTP